MKTFFLPENDFASFMGNMLKATKVIGPVAKKHKFVFAEIEEPDELRLDYDVTILPPKKAFFPPRQPLVTFDQKGYDCCIAAEGQVLFGVHFYDVKAIDMLDECFRSGHADENYLAHREATTIVASNIQKVSSRAFFASVGAEVKAQGHDASLTRIEGGYVYEVRTDKGEALLQHGAFQPATGDQVALAYQVNAEALEQCPEMLHHSSREISRRVRAAFGKDKIWEELAKDCFSCGSCNTTCPTCYCFDVQDQWNLDQVSGVRTRIWDGCLLEDFAQVSLGAGATENFREKQAERFRHRVMRKAAYLNEKLGGPACVGCGRCSVGCVADIADPVNIINRVMEG
jgi:sulfhydrogenase subunit beta (sulfur reductase)